MAFVHNGVASADDSAVFDRHNIQVKQDLPEKNHGNSLVYYEKYVEEKLTKHVVANSDSL